MIKVEIDKQSGFCFGVIKAIRKAESELEQKGTLYCLGDIVHNGAEVKRLSGIGLTTIAHDQYFKLKNHRVLIRAHGEPPEIYEYAKANHIELLDATCPVVLALQMRIKNSFEQIRKENGQLVIFGKEGHAEVIGINGQTGNRSIIVQTKDDLTKIDFSRPVALYSQTTMPIDRFKEIAELIAKNMKPGIRLEINDTICRQVANRQPYLEKFAAKYDVIIFVSGKKSSNGAVLYETCKKVNPRSYMVSLSEDIETQWFEHAETVGVCGATSTPNWLMEEIAAYIENCR